MFFFDSVWLKIVDEWGCDGDVLVFGVSNGEISMGGFDTSLCGRRKANLHETVHDLRQSTSLAAMSQ